MNLEKGPGLVYLANVDARCFELNNPTSVMDSLYQDYYHLDK